MEYLSDKSSVARMDKNLEKISPFELKNRLIEIVQKTPPGFSAHTFPSRR